MNWQGNGTNVFIVAKRRILTYLGPDYPVIIGTVKKK